MKSSVRRGSFIVLSVLTALGLYVLAYSEDGDIYKDWDKNYGEFMINRMKKEMNLTDEQITKVTLLFTSFRSYMLPLIKTNVKDMMDLRDKLFIGATDADIRPFLSSVNADNAKIAEAQKNFRDSLDAILTPIQQAKLLVMRDEMKFLRRYWRCDFSEQDFQ